MAMAHYCCLTGQRWHRDVGGFPCYASIFSLLHQGVIFPSLLAVALAPVIAGTLTWHDWLHNGWDDAPLACALFHYTILGYWCKDVVVPLSALMWVHHAACVGVVASLTGVAALRRDVHARRRDARTRHLANVVELRPTVRWPERDRRLRAACTALMWATVAGGVLGAALRDDLHRDGGRARRLVGRWSAAVVGGLPPCVGVTCLRTRMRTTPRATTRERQERARFS